MKPRVAVAFILGLVIGSLAVLLVFGRYRYEATGPGNILMWRHDRFTGRSYMSYAGRVWTLVDTPPRFEDTMPMEQGAQQPHGATAAVDPFGEPDDTALAQAPTATAPAAVDPFGEPDEATLAQAPTVATTAVDPFGEPDVTPAHVVDSGEARAKLPMRGKLDANTATNRPE